jgi:DNA-binding transcriptional LysR family regulator
MFDLHHLQHALALAEHRHFARAAEAAHITQSALSRSIQALEAHLGERLFERDRKRVELTPLGELFVQRAREIELSMRDLQREFELSRGMVRGELRVGVGPFGAAVLAGPVVGQLCREHPHFRIDIVLAPWQELPARLRAREIDLMVGGSMQVEGDEALDVVHLSPHPIVAVCRAGHPVLASGRAVDEAAMSAYPLAGPRLSQEMAALLDPSELQASRVVCDSSAVLKSIVRHSDAYALMNAFMVLDELREGSLVRLPGLSSPIEAQYGLVRLRHRTPSPAMRAFEAALLRHDEQLEREEQALLASP